MRETSHSITTDLGDAALLQLLAELATPAGQRDPYPIYARMRERGNALPGPDGALVVTGYRHCAALLRDSRLRKNPGRLLTAAGFPDWEQRPALRLMFRSMLMVNPPEHTRVRASAARVFTARRVAEMRPAVEALADSLLDACGGTVDFVEAVAFPFPVAVIGELLGVPAQDRPMFRGLVDDWAAVLEILAPPAVDRADEAASAIIAYFRELVARRRAEPRGDLLSALVAATDDDGAPLTEEEVITTAALILAAGFETTTGLLANAVVALTNHPDQADRLRREPELAKAAADELLRFDSPVQIIYGRSATDDIVVGDVALRAGQRVINVLGAANRDPAVFTAPDRLILDRDEAIPLSFGAGIHHCLGAALARLEAQVLLPKLLRRFPRLELAGEGRHRSGNVVRGYASLPVALG